MKNIFIASILLMIAQMSMGNAMITIKDTSTVKAANKIDISKTILWTVGYDPSNFTHMQTSFSSDSKYYGYGSDIGTVFIRDVKSSEIYWTFQENANQITNVLFQPNGSLVVSGDKKGNIVICDYVTKQTKYTFKAHKKRISYLCFNNTGDKLITGSKDKTIKVWDVASGTLLYEINSLRNGITGIKMSKDNNNIIVSTCAVTIDGLYVYDIQTGKKIMQYNASNVENFDISPNGKYIACTNKDKTINVWDSNSQLLFYTYKDTLAKQFPCCIAYSPDGNSLVCGGQYNELTIWNCITQKKIGNFTYEKNWFENISFSPNSHYLAALNNSGILYMIDYSNFISLLYSDSIQ